MIRVLFAAAVLFPVQAFAWNALGHKVVADIAWQTLDEAQRAKITDVLRRHPRYDEDFAQKMPANADEGRWAFQQAGCWPDIIRGRKSYDNPTWHYLDYAIFIGPDRPIEFNQATRISGSHKDWNVIQAVEYCRGVIADEKRPPSQRAVAYCWLVHLVGDLHQPCHSTALVCDRFPEGDRGGNLIKTRQGDTLHWLWDSLLGANSEPKDVTREIAQLRRKSDNWQVDTKPNPVAWLKESHGIARRVTYPPTILKTVAAPGELAPIDLPREYLTQAGATARQRVVAAGLRLGVLLGGDPARAIEVADDSAHAAADDIFADPPTARRPRLSATRLTAEPAAKLAYWINTKSHVRHNSNCQWFKNTKRGRLCSADEGKACGECGG
jgi:hypothetical protein